MEEQLILFETAILAQEKGFKEYSHYSYDDGEGLNLLVEISSCNESGSRYISAPTQSLLQKWLRDKHKIHVEPTLNFTNEEYPLHYNCGVMYNIDSETDFKWLGCESSYTFYKTYEKALEDGLIEALNLIKI